MWLCNDKISHPSLSPTIEKCSQEEMLLLKEGPKCLSKLFNMVLLCRNVIWKTTKLWYYSNHYFFNSHFIVYFCLCWPRFWSPSTEETKVWQTEAKHLDTFLRNIPFVMSSIWCSSESAPGGATSYCQFTCDQACHLSLAYWKCTCTF